MPFTATDLDTIDAAIKGGVREVRFQDRTVVYGTMAELMEARSLIYGELYAADAGRRVVRQIRVHGETGL